MHPLLKNLLQEAPVLTDGAWGTQLQARGLPIGDCPDAWNLLHPDRVEAVARAYVEAGSRVILTNTFGASRIALERYGLADRATEINRHGVEISRQAAGTTAKVFASIGPTGKMLLAGEVTEEAILDAFREQAQALAQGGADGLVVETMSDLTEAKRAVQAAKETGLPVVACMVFDAGKHRDRTMTGVSLEQAVAELEEVGADVVGTNCGNGAESMLPLCQRMRAVTVLPIWVKPNAGLPELREGKAVYTTTPAEFTEKALALTRAGADFIGGCCGTSPVFLACLAKALAKERGR